ncbi:ferredoxin [Candidatus Kuenenbacteria bacterium]|nr:ferredoxin [Candidatus Kuenenbacteria bacterium]
MTPKVNAETCIGCGTCSAVAGDVFKMNEANKAEVIAGDFTGKEEAINQAKDACPVQAITVE